MDSGRGNFAGKLVAVVGMQKSGFGAAELLLARGARVRAVDAKPTGEMRARCQAMGVELVPQSPGAFEGVDAAVLSPAVPPANWPAGIPLMGEVELAGLYLQGPTIAITGSNGKTTTTSLIGHILSASGIPNQVGGNIGVAPTSMVATSRSDQWNVLEVSSFQLATIRRFHPRVGVCMNVTQNHLDWHGGFQHYAASKRKLFDAQAEDDWAVLNADDEVCASFADLTAACKVWFSLERSRGSESWWFDGSAIHRGGEALMPVSEIRLRGRHNVQNVMAAAAATWLAGATFEQIRSAVATFEAVEHRIEFVRRLRGVDYYNDSKATSVDATLKSIDAFAGGLWIILGGKDKGSDYSVLREPLRRNARAALLIGAAAQKIADHLGDAVPLLQCGTLDAAVRAASERAGQGDTVLLAPACASFDQFNSFEHRGTVFKDLVRGLK